MRTRRELLEMRAEMRALPLLLCLGCATRPAVAPPPAPHAAPPPVAAAAELVDHSGDSTQTAIAVPADAPDGGVDFQNRWIYARYGRFRRTGGGTGVADGRRYNVVKIELSSGETRSVYFDITELWQKSLQQ
jgi:hypothetical protein